MFDNAISVLRAQIRSEKSKASSEKTCELIGELREAIILLQVENRKVMES